MVPGGLLARLRKERAPLVVEFSPPRTVHLSAAHWRTESTTHIASPCYVSLDASLRRTAAEKKPRGPHPRPSFDYVVKKLTVLDFRSKTSISRIAAAESPVVRRHCLLSSIRLRWFGSSRCSTRHPQKKAEPNFLGTFQHRTWERKQNLLLPCVSIPSLRPGDMLSKVPACTISSTLSHAAT